jgi:Acyltransferase family
VLVRTRYLSVLQLGGTVAIIAYHVGLRGFRWGWVAVDLFFVLAGVNMAARLGQSDEVIDYLRGRIRRMAPELAIAWFLVAVVTALGFGTRGIHWFLVTSPFFLQNLTEPLFQSGESVDWIYVPLWFVGALFQLQLLLFAFRKILIRNSPLAVLAAAMLVGVGLRWLTALAMGGGGGDIAYRAGDILYCLPVAHIEAVTLGVLVGRGSLVRLGRYLPLLVALTLGASLLNAWFSSPSFAFASLGLEFPFSTNLMYLWGYVLIAFVAAALCSPESFVAVQVQAMTLPQSWESFLSRLGSLTYGAYVFHGTIMASGINLDAWLKSHDVHFAGPMVFVCTVVEAFIAAHMARMVIDALTERADRVLKRASSRPSTTVT